jgi:hypothetical protein
MLFCTVLQRRWNKNTGLGYTKARTFRNRKNEL